MNKDRRKKIQQILQMLSDIHDHCSIASSLIEDVLDDETSCLDNMPENLEGSDRYQSISNAVDSLESARDAMQDVSDNLTTVKDELQSALE